jgi:hypothetical protein
MADYSNYWDWKEGEVRALRPGEDPPQSSLVKAFEGQDVSSADAIVLRGYLGRSDILGRAQEYLERALRIARASAVSAATTSLTNTVSGPKVEWPAARDSARTATATAAGLAAGLTEDQAEQLAQTIAEGPDAATQKRIANLRKASGLLDKEKELAQILDGAAAVITAQANEERLGNAALSNAFGRDKSERVAAGVTNSDVAVIELLIKALKGVTAIARPHIPWRLYLTPRLDRYVDFHRSSLLAYRREAKADRQDACTVWLRVFEMGAQIPIPYRLVQETTLVPSFATWINGQFVDDYGDESAFGAAWGDQAISGSYKTGPHCSNRTGPRCMG